jgi:hypothetical protein
MLYQTIALGTMMLLWALSFLICILKFMQFTWAFLKGDQLPEPLYDRYDAGEFFSFFTLSEVQHPIDTAIALGVSIVSVLLIGIFWVVAFPVFVAHRIRWYNIRKKKIYQETEK